MNSVFAAATLACVSQAVRLQGAAVADQYTHKVKACENGANISNIANKTVEECAVICNANDKCKAFEYGMNYKVKGASGVVQGDCREQSSYSNDGCDGFKYNTDLYVKPVLAPVVPGAGMDFEASLESRTAHEQFKHHQASHMTENEDLQTVREQKTEEYFAAKDAAKHANDEATAATAAEAHAHSELDAANDASTKANGEWEDAHNAMLAAGLAHANAVAAQNASATHHAKEVSDAEAAGHDAQKHHNEMVANASAALAKATAEEATAQEAKSKADAEKSQAEQAHNDASKALSDAHHTAGQANEHLRASKEAALAAHKAYVANVNSGATNGYIH